MIDRELVTIPASTVTTTKERLYSSVKHRAPPRPPGDNIVFNTSETQIEIEEI